MKAELNDRQLYAVDRGARKYIDEMEKVEATLHKVDAFGYGIEEWRNIHCAFQAGVKWAMRHHKILGMYKNKG